jgi:hypothetical protein
MSPILFVSAVTAFLKFTGSSAAGVTISFETLHAVNTTSSRIKNTLFLLLVILVDFALKP